MLTPPPLPSYATGLFESVNARVLPAKKGRFRVVFDFVEKR